MKKEYDINHIKSLLEAYYDGSTTIEQEKLLCDFFASTTDIPAELEADRQLFNSLHSALTNEIIVPNNLEDQLITHIDNLEKAEQNNSRKWIIPFTYISAAACLIALFTIGLNFIDLDNKLIDNETILVSENNINDTIDYNINNNIDKTPEVEPQEPVIVDEETEVPQETKKKKRTKRQRINKTNQLRLVSDEQIAYENTERALMLLSEKLNIAQEGVKQTENTIHEVNNTIIDII